MSAYILYDIRTQTVVHGPDSRVRQQKRADKANLIYGSHRYDVRRVNHA